MICTCRSVDGRAKDGNGGGKVATLDGQGTDERFRLFWSQKPGSIALPFDPDESIGARDIHLHEAMPLRPQPTKPTAEPSGAQPQAPPDFLLQRVSIEKPNAGDSVKGDFLTLQGPDHFERLFMHDKAGRTKPQPDPHVESDDDETGGSMEPRPR
jgi:hypothetical protein